MFLFKFNVNHLQLYLLSVLSVRYFIQCNYVIPIDPPLVPFAVSC